MNVHSSVGLKGRFKFVMQKASTGEITKETCWTDNIVLDTGLARMSVTGSNFFDRCLVGSGNSVPLVTDTSLTQFVASSTQMVNKYMSSNATTEPYYLGAVIVFRFAEGVGTGTLREVGLGWSNVNAWNKALIVDNEGNPTDLVKLEDEFLDIYCEVRMYVESSYSGSIQLLDKNDNVISEHTVTGLPVIQNTYFEPLNFGGSWYPYYSFGTKLYTGNMGTSIVTQPNGEELAHYEGNGSSFSITFPTQTSMLTEIVYGLNSAIGSIKSCHISRKDNFSHTPYSSWAGGYKFEFNPPIEKNNTQKLRFRHLLTWGRYVE